MLAKLQVPHSDADTKSDRASMLLHVTSFTHAFFALF